METFKQKFRQELEKNEQVMKESEKLKNTLTAKAASALSDKVSAAVSVAGEKLEQGGVKTIELIQKAAESKMGKTIGSAVDTVANQRVIKYVIDDLYEEERLRKKLKYIFRSPEGRKQDAELGIYYNPYTQRMEKMDEVERNETETGLVVPDEGGVRGKYGKQRQSRLETMIQTLNSKDLGGLSKVKSIINETMTSFGDKIFKETEESEVMTILKKRDETFDLNIFLGNIESVILPYVLDAYFRDDEKALKRYVTEECYRQHFYPRIYERNFTKTYFDTKILDIMDVTSMSIRFLANDPVIVVGCQMQYIYCIRDKVKNEIVEGHPNDIRMESQLWMFRQDPTMETNDWEIFECLIGVDPVKIV